MARNDYWLSWFAAQSWAIENTAMAEMLAFVEARLAGVTIDASSFQAQAAKNQNESYVLNGVGVVPIVGKISPKANLMTNFSGGTSSQAIQQSVRAFRSDDSVSKIVLAIDSPGGAVEGIAEVVEEVRQAREVKPVIAQVEHLAASAAYWIASQASEIVSSPSGRVGSIGVIAVVEEISKMLEAQGRNFKVVSAGKYKAEGNPFEPMSPEFIDYLKSEVQSSYEDFVSDVAKGRGVKLSQVKNGFGEGRVVASKAALAQNMIDRISTLEQTINRAQGKTYRKKMKAFSTIREFEAVAREELGLSHSEARALAAHGYKGIAEARDAPDDINEHQQELTNPPEASAELMALRIKLVSAIKRMN